MWVRVALLCLLLSAALCSQGEKMTAGGGRGPLVVYKDGLPCNLRPGQIGRIEEMEKMEGGLFVCDEDPGGQMAKANKKLSKSRQAIVRTGSKPRTGRGGARREQQQQQTGRTQGSSLLFLCPAVDGRDESCGLMLSSLSRPASPLHPRGPGCRRPCGS